MKLITIFGLLFKEEASYGAGGILAAATDGIQLAELPELNPEWANTGERVAPPGTLGYQRRVTPSGATVQFPLRIEPKGAGAAYSASVVPNIHRLLKACGFDAVLTASVGTEKWAYSFLPSQDAPISGVAELYGRGEKYPATGILLDLEAEFDGPGVPLITLTARALLGDPVDAAVPAITYPLATILPPKAVGAGLFTLNGVANLELRRARISTGWEFTPRVNMNAASGHAGWARGRRTPTAEFTFETPAKATLNPEQLWRDATEMAAAINVGSVQYNRHKWVMPKFQLSAPPAASADGSVALTTVTGQLNPSALGANDELTITFD